MDIFEKYNQALQSDTQKFVDREVILNVSGVISELIKGNDSLLDDHPGLAWADDLLGAVVDWLYERGDTVLLDLCGEFLNDEEEGEVEKLRGDEIEAAALMRRVLIARMDETLAEEIAAEVDIGPHSMDVLEHWAVTEWLASKLREHRETVEDVAGLHVWCRTTSGQAIALDDCIHRVRAAIHNS